MNAEAEARLAAALGGLDRQDDESRHAIVADLARQRAAAPRPDHVYTKQAAVAVAEPATDTTTGEFEAFVSDYLPDRQMQAFVPGAYDKAIAKIKQEGKATPILFGHSSKIAAAVLGVVPPDGWTITTEGLVARGWIDTEDPVGAKVYRMIQKGALTWSIGFTMTKTRPGRAGVTELIEVDELLELSVTPTAANERARTLSAKSLPDDDPEPPSLDELQARSRWAERELGLEDPEMRRFREEMRANMLRVMGKGPKYVDGDDTLRGIPEGITRDTNGNGDEKALSDAELRAKADALALEHAPIQIAAFEVD
jgi:HK97 family phage prohead protease